MGSTEKNPQMLISSMSKDHVFEMSIVLSVESSELGEIAMNSVF